MGKIGISLGDSPGIGIILIISVVAVALALRLLRMRQTNGMRAKCPKCGNVFDVQIGISAIHFGPYRLTKCPACGKNNMMNNFVKDFVTWPPKNGDLNKEHRNDEELKRERIEDSKYEEN